MQEYLYANFRKRMVSRLGGNSLKFVLGGLHLAVFNKVDQPV